MVEERHPAVLRFDDPSATAAADVVFLHGRGGSERDAGRAVAAFPRASVRAYRGPIAQGGGFSWFLNRAIGVADEASLSEQLVRVRGWIDTDRGRHNPLLCGFSNGAAMAASLALAEPSAFAGLVMIAGCFAVETLPAGGLAGLPVLFCRGLFDDVIPVAKFAQATAYLERDSGAHASIIDYPGGHEMPPRLLAGIADWFGRQLPEPGPAHP